MAEKKDRDRLIRKIMAGETADIDPAELEKLNGAMKDTVRFFSEHRNEIQELAAAQKQLQELYPVIEDILDKGGYDLTLEDVLEQLEVDGTPTTETAAVILNKAHGRQITINTAEKVDYPLDKPNTKIWNLLEDAEDGQLSFDIITSPKKAKKETTVFYSIDFGSLEQSDGITIAKRLDPFDKRVYLAAAAHYNAGNDIISETQIYKLMGYTGRPAAATIEKIHNSLAKMRAATINLKNDNELAAGMKYDAFSYDGSLLPFERVTAYINGQICEAAVHLFREPPMVTFARQRNQITSLKRDLLETPLSKTDASLRLEDYLIERIAHMKSAEGKTVRYRKILYSTLYKECNITEKKQRQRLPEKLDRLLNYWKSRYFIAGYAFLDDGVKIFP